MGKKLIEFVNVLVQFFCIALPSFLIQYPVFLCCQALVQLSLISCLIILLQDKRSCGSHSICIIFWALIVGSKDGMCNLLLAFHPMTVFASQSTILFPGTLTCAGIHLRVTLHPLW